MMVYHLKLLILALCFANPMAPPSRITDENTKEYILVSEGKGLRANIYEISIDTGAVRSLLPPEISREVKPLAIAVDGRDNTLYWTDTRHVCISKYRFRTDTRSNDDSSSYSTVLSKPSDDTHADCLTLDPAGLSLYYCHTEHKSNGTGSIRRIGTDGQNDEIFISSSTMKPRSVVVDSQNGHIYWSDYGTEPGIYRASMTGARQKTRIVAVELSWYSGLNIDVTGKWIYWAESKTKTIEKCRLDGSERLEIYRGAWNEKHNITGLALNKNSLFLTDWAKPQVRQMSRFQGRVSFITVPALHLEMANSIAVVSRTLEAPTTPPPWGERGIFPVANIQKTTTIMSLPSTKISDSKTHGTSDSDEKTSTSDSINFEYLIGQLADYHFRQGSDSKLPESAPAPTSHQLEDNHKGNASQTVMYTGVALCVIGVITIASIIVILALRMKRSKKVGAQSTRTQIQPTRDQSPTSPGGVKNDRSIKNERDGRKPNSSADKNYSDENVYDDIHYSEENLRNENSSSQGVDTYDEVSLERGLLSDSYDHVRYAKPKSFALNKREEEDGYLKPSEVGSQYTPLKLRQM